MAEDKAMESSRPHMPGYGLKGADEGAGLLDWSFVSQRMAAAHNYWISTTRPDGRPHAVPLWGLWHADAFFFSTGEDSRKGRNLRATPYAVVHLESGDEAVILEGRIRHESDQALLEQLNAAYLSKYGVDLVSDSPVYRLRPSVAFAWRERDFPESATRWKFG